MLSYAFYLTKIVQASQKLLVLQFVLQKENTFVQQSINMFSVMTENILMSTFLPIMV